MIRILLGLLLIISIRVHSQAAYQTGSPEWLVNKFFSEQSFPDKANYFIDEMVQQSNYPTIGEELVSTSIVKFSEIKKNESNILFSVNVKTENDQKDFYCYLVNSNGWKISAIRTFLIPVYYQQLADSIIADYRLPDSTKSVGYSIRLLAASDNYLKDYLKLNFNDFKTIVELFDQGSNGQVNNLLKKLNLSSVYKPDPSKECYFISILEINYLDAGFIFCRESNDLPVIDPTNFIIIEEVIKDWYLYRRN